MIEHIEKDGACEYCGAVTKEYIFKFDVLDAVLLVHMAFEVRNRLKRGMAFTKANAVHVPDMQGISLAVRCRTTQCSKLGLIAKMLGPNGRHIQGVWAITSRGWKALAGVEVPAEVKVCRGEITERTDKMITIREAFRVNADKVIRAIERKRALKNDYRAIGDSFQPDQWYQYSSMAGSTPNDGKLL